MHLTSNAFWNNLTEPFLFTYPGVQAQGIEPWREQGQRWRRLHVTFPDSIATHNPEQVFYYDPASMWRRMDYAPEVNGSPRTVHFIGELRRSEGWCFQCAGASSGATPTGPQTRD